MKHLLLVIALLASACTTPVLAPQPPPGPIPTPAPIPGPVYSDTGEYGAVHAYGITLTRDDGTIFPWRGITGFRLYEQWLLGHEGITNVVENWVSCGGLCAPGQGPNVVRVLGMVDSFAHLWPQEHADYYDQLGPFVDYLWFTWHLRVEFVIFADAQIIMPDRTEENTHALKVINQLMGHPGVVGVEVSNEPFKNIPGGGATAADIGRMLRLRGLNISSGDYDNPVNFLDYITRHGDRGPEWVRKIKDSLDYRDMFQKVTIDDEPMGAGEVDGRRSTNESDFAQFAAACQMFSAGCTYHSEDGINFTTFEPIQRAIAGAFFRAIRFVPVEAQFASYRRGGEVPGCNWVGGESLVQHDDALELRSFGKQVGNQAWVVQFRTLRPVPLPCPGWRVAEVLRPGIYRVER